MAEQRVLLKGEEAIVLAAAIAGADLYGYPITPVTGVVEMASRLFPRIGRIFLQAESEVAAANMAYGASAVGQRVLCVSSSPGVSLKQEAISYMCGAELPGVFVNAMRGGPGLGNIGASQADYFQATRGGGHGDYYTPVFAPSTVAETFEHTLEAFNVADRYRTPVMVIIDGSIAQSAESVRLGADAAAKVRRFDKPWAACGAAARGKNVVTSFRLEPLEALENLNIRLQEKYARIRRELADQAELTLADGADVLVVAYGSMAGLAEAAVRAARVRGIKAGLFRPRMVWPFPEAMLRRAARDAKAVVVFEMSAGQMLEDVRLAIGSAREVSFFGRMGGIVPDEAELVEQIVKASERCSRTSAAELAARSRLLEDSQPIITLPAQTAYDEPAPVARTLAGPAADQDVVAGRALAIEDLSTHYCPGCGHGNLHQIIARVIDELAIRGRTVMIEPVGCSVVTYWDVDTIQAAHGRGMALATAVSRTLPDRVVVSYQGDGDLASIGMAETVHAASRGEDFVLIFVNNCIYGMTGGQMAPTSIPGLATTTTPQTGRDVADVGPAIDMCKLFSQLGGVTFLERVAIDSPAGLTKTAKAVRAALKLQADGVGGTKIVEVLSPCPVGWKMTPAAAHRYIKEVVSKHFPLGRFKDAADAARPHRRCGPPVEPAEVFSLADLHWVTQQAGYRPAAGRFAQPGLRIAGHGGQGIILLSNLLTHAAVRSGKRVSLLPSYGSAMRGGTSNCQVRIADGPIPSPYVSSPDILVAMNQPSFDKFAPSVHAGSVILADSTLVTRLDGVRLADGVQLAAYPITSIAEQLGNERMANMVAAGLLVGLTGLLDPQAVRDSVPEIFAARAKLVEPNLSAFNAGLETASAEVPAER